VGAPLQSGKDPIDALIGAVQRNPFAVMCGRLPTETIWRRKCRLLTRDSGTAGDNLRCLAEAVASVLREGQTHGAFAATWSPLTRCLLIAMVEAMGSLAKKCSGS